MNHFCTYFDHRYLPRGLALYQSLKQHCSSFQLWVLCLNQACYDVLSQLNLPDINLISLEDFERGDEKLLTAKQNRTLIEYYFTCTPSLPLFVLNKCPEVDLITYLDSDLFFFSTPEPIYQEIADSSIAIIEHRFSPDLRDQEKFGIYNVGWLSFRRDADGLTCLQWWRERCIEWCYDQLETERFADQKYLDDWPTRFPNVVVLQHKGANLAGWNSDNYKIYAKGNRIWVDRQPLIFFHFHGFNQLKMGTHYINPGINVKRYSDAVIFQNIYGKYIRTLIDIKKEISPLLPEVSLVSTIRNAVVPDLRETKELQIER